MISPATRKRWPAFVLHSRGRSTALKVRMPTRRPALKHGTHSADRTPASDSRRRSGSASGGSASTRSIRTAWPSRNCASIHGNSAIGTSIITPPSDGMPGQHHSWDTFTVFESASRRKKVTRSAWVISPSRRRVSRRTSSSSLAVVPRNRCEISASTFSLASRRASSSSTEWRSVVSTAVTTTAGRWSESRGPSPRPIHRTEPSRRIMRTSSRVGSRVTTGTCRRSSGWTRCRGRTPSSPSRE